MSTRQPDPDEAKGAVEDQRPGVPSHQANENAPGLDERGMPNDPVAIAEDAIGANEDDSQG
jgi:hypothetical protein